MSLSPRPNLGHLGMSGACQSGNATGIWLSALLFCAFTWPCVAGQKHYIMPELEMLMILPPDLSEKSPTRRSPMPCPELTAVIQISQCPAKPFGMLFCWIRSEQLMQGRCQHSLLSTLCGIGWVYKHYIHRMKSPNAKWSSFASRSSWSVLGWGNLLRTSQECNVWDWQSNARKFEPATSYVSSAGIIMCLADSLYLNLWPFSPLAKITSNFYQYWLDAFKQDFKGIWDIQINVITFTKRCLLL